MPITPLPASSTKRYFVRTVAGGLTHHTQIRVRNTVGDAAAIAAFQNDFTILLPSLGSDVVIDGLEVAAEGSDIRNPVSGWTTLNGTAGTAVAGQDRARSFSLRGRSDTGRKTKMLIWGVQTNEQPDFELALADQTTAMSNFQAQVQARADYYLAIDYSKPDWRTNYLEDYNDHWQRELRP